MSKKELSPEQREQLARVAALPDDQIDTADIPEAPAENWVDARRSNLYRPLKQPVTIRLDLDVLTWFKERFAGGRYQTEINRVLRRYVIEAEKQRPKPPGVPSRRDPRSSPRLWFRRARRARSGPG